MNKNKNKHILPFVTFIIPTLNAQKYLERCLKSIRKQVYPLSNYEILVIDGGSKDGTRKIAKKYGAKIINNPYVDQESGKSLGIRESKGEIFVLMDSDNEIIKKDWLRKMIKPIQIDSTLFGVESLYFSKKGDNIFNTYCMLLHIADPFSRMLASKLFKGKKKEYIEYTIPKGGAYPLGANGFLWNRKVVEKVGFYKPKFEESNFSYFIMQEGYRKFARVPGYGIYHYHVASLGDFISKRIKIGNKFLNRKEEKKRTWLEGVSSIKFIFSIIYCATFIGPFLEGYYNFFKTKNKAWLLHPIFSFLSVVTYGYIFLQKKIWK